MQQKPVPENGRMRLTRPDEIHSILERKLAACDEFLSATLLLKKALEAEEMEKVRSLIERRLMLMGVIEGLNREIVGCQKTGLHNPNEETGRRTAAISANLMRNLRQSLSENRDCDAIASDRLSRLRKELLHLHENKEGLHQYSRRVERIPKFLNVRT